MRTKQQKKVDKAVARYIKVEKALLGELANLKNWGGDCNCEIMGEKIKIIHEGNFDEIITYCINCGGWVV